MSLRRPEWAPDSAGSEFASRVMTGVRGAHDGMTASPISGDTDSADAAPSETASAGTGAGAGKILSGAAPKRRQLSPAEYRDGVLAGDRTILSRAITLVESNSPAHFDLAQQVVRGVLDRTGNSVRIGITGVPGAGKSTFIEALGCRLCDEGRKVAILAVDPSSSVSKGSILGDKTRMENLAKRANAFIRPSPSGGMLGGLTRKSRETLLLCEAAGYDVILVETVGVGQSEITVRSMVDFFLLIVITGAGDELQGMKKGVMELADAILVNKSDGANKLRAEGTRVEYDRILHYLRPATEGWTTRAHTCSSTTGQGIGEIWNVVMDFVRTVKASGVFDERRRQQTLAWVYRMIEDHLYQSFYACPAVTENRRSVEERVVRGDLLPTQAAQALLELYERY